MAEVAVITVLVDAPESYETVRLYEPLDPLAASAAKNLICIVLSLAIFPTSSSGEIMQVLASPPPNPSFRLLKQGVPSDDEPVMQVAMSL